MGKILSFTMRCLNYAIIIITTTTIFYVHLTTHCLSILYTVFTVPWDFILILAYLHFVYYYYCYLLF